MQSKRFEEFLVFQFCVESWSHNNIGNVYIERLIECTLKKWDTEIWNFLEFTSNEILDECASNNKHNFSNKMPTA